MNRQTTRISPADVDRQRDFCQKLHERFAARPSAPLAFVDTYGCQQNEADSERLRGYLSEMGYQFTQSEAEADLIVINTCAIREHAEMRVLGNVGALVHTKRAKPGQLICVCGCMAQEPHMAQKIKDSYRQVDLVFGPHALWRFPELLYRLVTRRGRIFDIADEPGSIAEGIPLVRQEGVKAWVSIMYGCNNFCTYCIVPYVRGRSAPGSRRSSWTKSAAWWPRGTRTSPFWARTSTPTARIWTSPWTSPTCSRPPRRSPGTSCSAS